MLESVRRGGEGMPDLHDKRRFDSCFLRGEGGIGVWRLWNLFGLSGCRITT